MILTLILLLAIIVYNMYTFPDTLYPEPQQMFFNEDLFYGFSEDTAIFFSIKDGNWGDRGTW